MTPLSLGGEMPHWSDDSPAGGAALRDLLADVHGHVLIAGPHDPELIDAVPAREVTVLVRGVPDAERLAARYADRPGVRICCGSLDKMAAVAAYDTVVALDGLDRTGSTETTDLPWPAGLAQLLAVLRPGGRLLLGVPNPLGLHRLYTSPASPGWTSSDDLVPAGPAPLHAHLREAGLTVLRDYAAYPGPTAPTALLSDTALADPDLHGVLTSALRRAGLPPGALLADPRPHAAALLRHRLAGALAPGRIVVAARPGHQAPALPDVVLTGGASTTRLRRDAHGWSWDPSGAPVPAGRCLHDALLAAARSPGHPELRALLTTWQSGPCATIDADEIVVAADGTLHPMPTATAPGSRASALHRLATALHREGLADLWPADDTIGLLAAMSGAEITPPAGPPSAPETLRELRDAHDRLAQQVSEARARLAWYEQRTATLQRDLSRAHRIIAVLKGTAPGKAAKVVLDGARSGKRLARAAIRRFRT